MTENLKINDKSKNKFKTQKTKQNNTSNNILQTKMHLVFKSLK